jgi:1-deoxy-D-xylulose-5-phosphate reductoisomerase
VGPFEFEEPDRSTFRCLDLAFRAGTAGDLVPAWLNAANEVAVEAFLAGRIGWATIAGVVEGVLDAYSAPSGTPATAGVPARRTVEDVLDADATARRIADRVITSQERTG